MENLPTLQKWQDMSEEILVEEIVKIVEYYH